jgi:hypothetical protein
MDEKIRKALIEQLMVPLWPHAGKALGLSRNSTYKAFWTGQIEGEKINGKIVAKTASLRRRTGLDAGVPAK